ncbi:DUF7322 domain-containing protein [Natrarchaeobaculum sulfurireducens]|uniref:DUF7322 domain-containing protein n=1 Tax=Natrarchaeobaculum sulfurireducens TaxID=2044521 RepID=A0A346PCC3_9EURY|nr:hypothetical protein [Natrarchaeobaculum sulfurireducens]AXR77168.1 hypothetical protein AArc1_0826 [Natrarchaeobaculum sulfurireducens]
MVFDPSDDDPFADDPFEDPFADDPLEDPFADGRTDTGSDGADDIEKTLGEIPRATLLAFIVVGVLVHAGLFAAALGLMLVGFRGQWLIGGGLAAGGFLALFGAIVQYRRFRRAQ